MAQVTGNPTATRNHDIFGVYNRMNRFIEEMYHSVSADVSQMNSFDQARMQKYIDNIRGYVAWVVGQPQLDLPETAPREYPLEAPPVIGSAESEEINDILHMLVVARDEIISSQSARDPSGLIPFDAARFGAVIDKIEAFLKTYVATLTPLDLPESSPQAPTTGPGRTGI
jgi:hypothetical protein